MAVQITGLLRFRQPFFLDITYTHRYVLWFLPRTYVDTVLGVGLRLYDVQSLVSR